MKIAVASGKGGTGKTTVSVSLALSIEGKAQFLDLDVEEPDAHIFLRPEIEKEYMASLPVPRVMLDKCDFCGVCQDVCAYNAIFAFANTKQLVVFDELCKGCGACTMLCPQKALYEVQRPIGIIREGWRDDIHFFEGRLNIGEITTTSLIKIVKEKAGNSGITVIDSPPGTSCPMVEAVRDADYVLLVTEPTPFGLYDLKIAHGVVKKLGKPHGIVINKYGMGDEEVEKYAEETGTEVLLKIPFEKKIAEAYARGIPLYELDEKWKIAFRELFEQIGKKL